MDLSALDLPDTWAVLRMATGAGAAAVACARRVEWTADRTIPDPTWHGGIATAVVLEHAGNGVRQLYLPSAGNGRLTLTLGVPPAMISAALVVAYRAYRHSWRAVGQSGGGVA